MSDKLNMSLDDVIKQTKKAQKKGGPGGKKGGKGGPGNKKVGGKKVSRPVKPVSGKVNYPHISSKTKNTHKPLHFTRLPTKEDLSQL